MSYCSEIDAVEFLLSVVSETVNVLSIVSAGSEENYVSVVDVVSATMLRIDIDD